MNRGTNIALVVIVLGVFAGGVGYWVMMPSAATPVALTDTLREVSDAGTKSVAMQTAPVTGNAGNSVWQLYRTIDFEIKYPPLWRVVMQGPGGPGAPSVVSFGDRMGNGYDGDLFVFGYDKSSKTVEQFIQEMGTQFADRVERRENITVNGVSALKVTVTTPSVPDWMYEAVIIEQPARFYVMHNGAIKKEAFVDFYNSFRFMKSGTEETAVRNIRWIIEKANPTAAADSYQSYEQAISVDITNASGTKRYSVGKSHGCTDTNSKTLWDGTPVLGHVNCYFAASGVGFTAYDRSGKIVIERFDEDASGKTSGKKTVVLEI